MEGIIKRTGLFVPPLPTLWPKMLLRSGKIANYYPFCAEQTRYFYFARNAIWQTVKMLALEQREVLVPAYHHGVEIEALIAAGARVKFYRVVANWDVDLEDVKKKISADTGALYLIH